jgi:hypothetical protein
MVCEMGPDKIPVSTDETRVFSGLSSFLIFKNFPLTTVQAIIR